MSEELNATSLVEFSLIEHPNMIGRFEVAAYGNLVRMLPPFPSWNFPQLHGYTLQNYSIESIPPQDYDRLDTLTLKIAHDGSLMHKYHDVDVFATEAHMELLTHLLLSYDNCCFRVRRRDQLFDDDEDTPEIANIKTLSFHIVRCTQLRADGLDLWNSFNFMHFPAVVELSVLVDIGDENLVWNGMDITLQSVLAHDVSRYRFPFLETLDVTVLPRCLAGEQIDAPTVLFLHCCTPTVKRLRIQSPFDLTISGDISDSEDSRCSPPGDWEEARPTLLDLRVDDVPIALQTIFFDVPSVQGVVPWVRELVSKMRDQGCWDGFTELTVARKGEMKVISRDDVEDWCDANQDL